jgi:hypothetical protein
VVGGLQHRDGPPVITRFLKQLLGARRSGPFLNHSVFSSFSIAVPQAKYDPHFCQYFDWPKIARIMSS